MDKVSILVNCLNGEAYLKQAIDSIYAQTHSNWEIIFIDNASTDKTSQIAQSYDQKLKYYCLPETIPLYAARNEGLKKVSGNFIAFLDADDYWTPQKLTSQLKMMQAYPSIYLICSGFFRFFEQMNKMNKQVGFTSYFLNFKKTLNKYPINLSTVMLRYNAISKPLIYFETSLNLTGDYELFVKLVYQFEAYYLAKPLTVSRIHHTNLSAKLMQDWPRELRETHARWEQTLPLSEKEKSYAEKRLLRASSYIYLAKCDYLTLRQAIKKYWLKDWKLSMIYIVSFHSRLANKILQIRGFK